MSALITVFGKQLHSRYVGSDPGGDERPDGRIYSLTFLHDEPFDLGSCNSVTEHRTFNNDAILRDHQGIADHVIAFWEDGTGETDKIVTDLVWNHADINNVTEDGKYESWIDVVLTTAQVVEDFCEAQDFEQVDLDDRALPYWANPRFFKNKQTQTAKAEHREWMREIMSEGM